MQAMVFVTGSGGSTKIKTLKTLAQKHWHRYPYMINMDSYPIRFMTDKGEAASVPSEATILVKIALRMKLLHLENRPVIVASRQDPDVIKAACVEAGIVTSYIFSTDSHTDSDKLAAEIYRVSAGSVFGSRKAARVM